MAEKSQQTTNYEVIRAWIEEHRGKPAIVGISKEDGSGILRSGKESLEKISWDKFFEIFEDNDLTLLYQYEIKYGETSRISKFVNW